MTPTIIKVSGPLVVADNMQAAKMYEVVRVGREQLVGEVIKLEEGQASIQVYEDTAGVGPGEPVQLTGQTLSVELGPGIMENIYDGIQRPLHVLEEKSGHFITRGITAPGLDQTKKWAFTPTVKEGQKVAAGDIIGTVPETEVVEHRVMVPYGISGTVKKILSGQYKVTETICIITDDAGKDHEVALRHFWPIRVPRPVARKTVPEGYFRSGWRIIDSFFPIVKGGAACIPGPFGAGKTVSQQTIAKYCNAEVLVYIGCGERGNEMTEVLDDFPKVEDPQTGQVIMKRTTLIANTSNMPVAAREASVYTGITIAEYYRDMGYSVALMADSTSRWAEAMREISGRMEEMPGEEGYPAYLGSKIAEFYERAGAVETLGSEPRSGYLTVIGAVSPPGGDLSEPVSQNTLRVTKCYWGLDKNLAYQKHFPSINWLKSYSLYGPNMKQEYAAIAEDFESLRVQAMDLTQQQAKLQEIVRLVGPDALSTRERLVLHTAGSIIEDFLRQDAFDERDINTPLRKQYEMLKTSLTLYNEGMAPLTAVEDLNFRQIEEAPVMEKIARMRYIEMDNLGEFEAIRGEIRALIAHVSE
ncbi:V-type ATP synthase subunit A [Candidatus Peribacteria bacterium]|nr:V-type ATP synthase subunit A [Candidatus Peribacteria bacterium]